MHLGAQINIIRGLEIPINDTTVNRPPWDRRLVMVDMIFFDNREKRIIRDQVTAGILDS